MFLDIKKYENNLSKKFLVSEIRYIWANKNCFIVLIAFFALKHRLKNVSDKQLRNSFAYAHKKKKINLLFYLSK